MVKVKIYSKSFCPYCMRAKMLLKSMKVNFEEVLVKTQKDFTDLSKKTGSLTVPQIFVNENFIGGCDDLFKLKEDNKLKEILSDG